LLPPQERVKSYQRECYSELERIQAKMLILQTLYTESCNIKVPSEVNCLSDELENEKQQVFKTLQNLHTRQRQLNDVLQKPYLEYKSDDRRDAVCLSKQTNH
jgi:signal transduction histidine kinase